MFLNNSIEMADIVKLEDVKNAIVPLRGVEVIPDFLVAHLYGVQTKEVNQAVKNNPYKFPEGFIMEYSKEEKSELVKKFDQFNIKHSSAKVKGFTEKGLYMLATILKSPIATQTTLAIVNTFAEVRELKHRLLQVHDTESQQDKKIGMKRIGDILADLIMPDLETTETQSSLEFNFVIGKLKHSVTRQRKNDNADIILREKVVFAKRLLSKGFQEKEVLELANITEDDIIKIKNLL
ncbi:MAG: ORF6N domain-containing protein [Muribaculaceae bacterium]|nr:ORF6N domain-containing protein [Muribaculaceae bacterium]